MALPSIHFCKCTKLMNHNYKDFLLNQSAYLIYRNNKRPLCHPGILNLYYLKDWSAYLFNRNKNRSPL